MPETSRLSESILSTDKASVGFVPECETTANSWRSSQCQVHKKRALSLSLVYRPGGVTGSTPLFVSQRCLSGEFGLCHETSLPGSSTVGIIVRRSHSPQGHQTELACPKMDCRKPMPARRRALPPRSL